MKLSFIFTQHETRMATYDLMGSEVTPSGNNKLLLEYEENLIQSAQEMRWYSLVCLLQPVVLP